MRSCWGWGYGRKLSYNRRARILLAHPAQEEFLGYNINRGGRKTLITCNGQSDMNQEILRRIRRAVRTKQYQITDHALEKADADDLTLDDILYILLNGELDSIYTADPRGSRYVLRGNVSDNLVDVVCRFRSNGTLLIIITVYVVI